MIISFILLYLFLTLSLLGILIVYKNAILRELEQMHINEKDSPFLIFLITIIFLLLLSLLPRDAKVAGILIKPVDLFMDVKPDSLLD